MKTLVNKNNPASRITAPEIIEEEEYYTLDGETVFPKENWTFVEEEPTEGIKGNLEEIPSNVDLDLVRKIISTYKSIVHREEEAAIDWYMDDDNTGISYKEMTPEEIYKEVCGLIKKQTKKQ